MQLLIAFLLTSYFIAFKFDEKLKAGKLFYVKDATVNLSATTPDKKKVQIT